MWLLFLVYSGLIIVAGTQLSKNAELVSDGLGLSKAWAGTLLLSIGTSLPELVASCRAAMIGAPDLAGGNIFGSNLFNLLILILVGILYPRGLYRARRKRGLIVTALFSIILAGISLVAIVVKLPWGIGWVGLDSIFVFGMYLLASAIITGLERNRNGSRVEADNKTTRSGLARALYFYLLAAAIIVFAGVGLTDTSKLIALETGLGETMIGSILIAAATSLPELATSITSICMGLPEMAIGVVFGSNLFNILLFFFGDIFYREGLLLGSLSFQHLVTAVMGMVLTTVAVIGLLIPSRRNIFGINAPSWVILGGYLVTFLYLFYMG
ncbi:MAG: sodium:calcium antiporter [Dethiobacteria bacterium]|jgi:cation:H+ antiporter